MNPGKVVGIAPGKSVVRLASGQTVVARNGLNTRTPPNARVLVVQVERGWVVVARER